MVAQLPANVNLSTLLALAPGTALTGVEPFETVQSGTSVAVTGQQILSFVQTSFTAAALSVLGVTGAASASVASISGVANQVLRVNAGGTGLGFGALNLSAAAAVTGNLPLANITSLTGLSVLGVTGTATGTMAALTGTSDQVLRIAQGGTTLGFGAINLATSAAVTGVLGTVNGGLGTTIGATNSVFWSGGAAPSFTTTPIIGGLIASTSQNSTATFVRFFNSSGDATVQQQGGFGSLWWQVVQSAANGNSMFWSGGATPNISSALLVFTNTNLVQVNPGQALVSGGSRATGLSISSVTSLGVFAGTGAPTFAAGTSSLYFRNDGATNTTRLYINTNGATTWAAVTA